MPTHSHHASAAVSCRAVSKRFESGVVAVSDVHLDVAPGELLCLLGPSGCGKTTLLRLLAGLERLDTGTISIAGRIVASGKGHVPPERRRVGMVFQDYALFPHLTVQANVAYGLNGRIQGGDGAHVRKRIAYLLELVGLAGNEQRFPHQLSGGQQQRLALARALAPAPDVILLDEPFSNLDQALRRRLRREVRDILTQAGATAVFVTHDQEEALSIAHRLAVMWNGRIVQAGAPAELYRYPATRAVASFLGEANFVAAFAHAGRAESELGVFPAPAWLNGPVELMLRPEALELTPAESADNVVIGSSFFGHDQLVRVRLQSGLVVEARAVGMNDFHPGQRVKIAINGSPMILAADEAAASAEDCRTIAMT